MSALARDSRRRWNQATPSPRATIGPGNLATNEGRSRATSSFAMPLLTTPTATERNVIVPPATSQVALHFRLNNAKAMAGRVESGPKTRAITEVTGSPLRAENIPFEASEACQHP